jgi:hypothetical protein
LLFAQARSFTAPVTLRHWFCQQVICPVKAAISTGDLQKSPIAFPEQLNWKDICL